jgi:hypothetical protein
MTVKRVRLKPTVTRKMLVKANARPRGRPKGSKPGLTKINNFIQRMQSGMLPHEMLLEACQTGVVKLWDVEAQAKVAIPLNVDQWIDVAKYAAPYYASRHATIAIERAPPATDSELERESRLLFEMIERLRSRQQQIRQIEQTIDVEY